MVLVETVAVVESQVYCRSMLGELFVYSSQKSCIKSCNDRQAAVIVEERAKRMTLCFRRKYKCQHSYFVLQRWSLIKTYKKVNNTC